jgi:DNA-binding MarR family transcriptional regulator
LPNHANIEDADQVRRVADFRLALQRFERTSDRVVRQSGLTPRQYLLLLALDGRHGGSASIGALTRELVLAQSTVTELVDRAQTEGLVERVVARDDARVVLVGTTREGSRRLARALAALERERDRLGVAIDELNAALSRARATRRVTVSPPATGPRRRA